MAVKEITAAFKNYPYKVELIDPTTFRNYLFGPEKFEDGLFLLVENDERTHPFIYDQGKKVIIYSGSFHRSRIDDREVQEMISGNP